MEDRDWTDFTLDVCVEMFGKGWDVGAVLQSRLHRTKEDLARIPEGMRCRLVIGIYPEPAEVAITDKHAMKERMLDYAAHLLTRGVFVEFATHDVAFVERFARDVAPTAPENCEVQMLLGVPRARCHRQKDLPDMHPLFQYQVLFILRVVFPELFLSREVRRDPVIDQAIQIDLYEHIFRRSLHQKTRIFVLLKIAGTGGRQQRLVGRLLADKVTKGLGVFQQGLPPAGLYVGQHRLHMPQLK